MIHFDEIKGKVIACLKRYVDEEDGIFYVIRDVYGKISIYMTGAHEPRCVKECISDAIGSNWVGQVRTIDERSILYDEITKCAEKAEDDIYYGERPLVKKSWTYKAKEKPQSSAENITFYSYKGGVGRTTTLALVALQMVRKGKRVVVVDMDLEAPGLSTILKQEVGIAYPKYGVIDFLIECPIEIEPDFIDMDEYVYSFTSKELLGMNGGELFVMQAANLSVNDEETYYEKLSRIDFNMPQFNEQDNSVSRLFERLNEQYHPDYILIDSRAGIHDIGGLTLFHYSDEVVALFYGNEQNMIGLNFVLPKLCQQDIPFYLINTPVPILEDAAEEEIEYYVSHSYDALEKANFFDEIPDLFDESSVHYPLNISYDVVAANLNSESKLLQLLLRDSDKNVYGQIANMLEKPQNDVENQIPMIITEKQSILQSIGRIFHSSTASAEDEFDSYDSLKNNFYPLKEYKYIFDHNKFLITGSKGSGKTALFKVLKCKTYAEEMAEYIGVPTSGMTSTTWLVGLDKTEEFPMKANFMAIGKTQNIEYYSIYWKLLAVRTLKDIIQYYGINNYEYLKDIISCKYSQIIGYIQKYQNMNEELSELFCELNKHLEEEEKTVIITYDSLDFCIDKEFRGGLISELIAFWAENNLRYKNLRTKIFLRNDILKNEVMLTDKIKLNNYRSNIEWSYDYLLAMIWKRMMEADNSLKLLMKEALEKEGYSLSESQLVGIIPRPGEEMNKIMLNVLVGEKMGKGNKTYTYNWILYRLSDTNSKIVPRSIIKLFSSAARHELQEVDIGNKDGSKIIKPRSLENSVKEVSEDRVTDMSDEYPEYKQVFENLGNYCSIFPTDEDTLHNALIKCGIEKNQLKTVINHLIEIGILKEYQRKKTDPIRYHIPDIYLKGMKLKRRGRQ